MTNDRLDVLNIFDNGKTRWSNIYQFTTPEINKIRKALQSEQIDLKDKGLLRAPLPKIKGLGEAFQWQRGMYSFYDFIKEFKKEPLDVINDAAKAYYEHMGKTS